jgi:hypothetical protein
MTHPDRERPELSREDAAFVERIASLSDAPGLSATRRVAFQAELDRRLARRSRWLLRPALVGTLAAGAAAALLLLAGPDGPEPDEPAGERVARAEAMATGSTTTPDQALLSLMDESDDGVESALPADYVAIESLILGG